MGIKLFNWLPKLIILLVLSNVLDTVRNVVQMAVKRLFFHERSQKSPTEWGLCPQTPFTMHFSCTNLLGTLLNCGIFQTKKILVARLMETIVEQKLYRELSKKKN